MNEQIKLLDVVALLVNIPSKKLSKGQVGTIVEILDNNIFEVEFCNRLGETLFTCAISKEQLLLLHYDLKAA